MGECAELEKRLYELYEWLAICRGTDPADYQECLEEIGRVQGRLALLRQLGRPKTPAYTASYRK